MMGDVPVPSTARGTARERFAKVYRDFGPWTAKRKKGFTRAPENFVKGVLGIGPALTATAAAAARAVPTLARAAVAPEPDRTNARLEVAGAVGAIAQGAVEGVKEAVKDPVGTATQYPFEILPLATGAARLAAGATGAGARSVGAAAAAREANLMHGAASVVGDAGKEVRALRGVASASRKLGAAAGRVAAEGPVRIAFKEADRALERTSATYAQWKQGGYADEAIARADQSEILSRNRDYKQFWEDYGHLTPEHHEEFVRFMGGFHPHDEPISHEVFRAIESWKRLPGQVQAEWLRMGKLNPVFEAIPRHQPARVEEFGAAVPKVMRRDADEAAAAARADQSEIDAFVRAVGAQGGDRGPIDNMGMQRIGRYLRGLDPAVSRDPMKLAKEIWEREAPRLARAGLYPKRYLGDFDRAMKAARKGGYTETTAPLFHQIEGIVKGAMVGVERPFPKGLLGGTAPARSPGDAMAFEIRDALGNSAFNRRLQKRARASVRVNDVDPDWMAKEAANPGYEAEVVARTNAMVDGKAEIPLDVMERVFARDATLRREIGGEIETRLQRLRAKQVQTAIPDLDDVVDRIPNPAGRSAWQMTREEWDALPDGVRKRKMRTVPEETADPYAYLVERAVARRKAVPRQVLEQNDQWLDDALTPANRRLRHVTDEVAAAIAERGNAEPIYFPLIREPIVMNWRNIFSRFSRGERFKPRSLKQRFGQTYAEGEFVKDPRILAARTTDDLRKYQRAEQIITGILTDKRIPKRPIKSAADLQPGEVAWSPDGLRMWRRQVEFGQRFLGEMERFGVSEEGAARALGESIKAGIGEGAWAVAESGPAKRVVYAIPASVGKKLAAAYQEAPAWIRELYDPISGAWRWAVLVARPAWVFNNTIGNTVFSTLNGVAPRHYLMALQEQFKARTPDELNGITLTAAEADLGITAGGTGPLAQLREWLSTKPSPTGIGEALAKRDLSEFRGSALFDPRRPAAAVRRYGEWMRGINQSVESFYRRANFLKESERLARKRYVQRAGKSFGEAFSLLDEMDSFSARDVEKVVEKVNYFMHDYGALKPWERAWLRRAVPFVNFLKHQYRLVTQLPLDYPGRATMLQALAAAGREAQAYDNSMLPEYLRDKGLADTGIEVEVDGRKLRAFVSTTGINPLIIGYNPAGGSEAAPADIPAAAGFAYSQASPLVKYPLLGLHRGHDPATGRPLTRAGVYEVDGKFFRFDEKEGFVPAEPPMPGPVEYLAGNIPALQALRRIREPRAGHTADPLSTAPSRQFANRTAATELLRYFTPLSIVLVDQRDVRRRPLNQRQTYNLIYQMARERRYSAPAVAGRDSAARE